MLNNNTFLCKISNPFLLYRFNIVSEENLGNYSCVFGSEAKIDFVLAGTDHILYMLSAY